MHFVLQTLNWEPRVLWKPQKGKQPTATVRHISEIQASEDARLSQFRFMFVHFVSADHLQNVYGSVDLFLKLNLHVLCHL